MKYIILFSLVTSIAALNLNCSSGLNQSSNVVTETLPTTLSNVLTIVGSFLNNSWYGTPGNFTVGLDNHIGSIRTFMDFTRTNTYNETLLVYTLSSTYFKQSWQGPGNNGTSINFGVFILGYYVEYLTVQSTCGGSAVIINFGSDACVTNPNTAVGILTDNHVYGIQQIQTLLNIGNFTSCPAVASSMRLRLIRSSNLLIGLISIMVTTHFAT